MFFGGWSYPDVLWIGATGAGAAFNEAEFDCAAMGTDIAPATSDPAKRQFKSFRICIRSLHFDSPGKAETQSVISRLWTTAQTI
jgi:hypothetical protein